MKRTVLELLVLSGLLLATENVFAQQPGRDKDRDGRHHNPSAQPAAVPQRPQSAPQTKPAPQAKPGPQVKQTPQPKPGPQAKPAPQTKPTPQAKPTPQVKPPTPQPKPGVTPQRPQPAPQVKPPTPQPPAKPVVKPAPDYRPGHKKYALRKPPFAADHYRGWTSVLKHHRYLLTETFTQSRVLLPIGHDIEFELEEDSARGYRWFARFDPQMVDVDIDHHRPDRRHFWSLSRPSGVPGYAEIEIEAGHYLGGTIVELVYARPDEWERGIDPIRVIEVYVEIVR
ncbi:MAG: hypothetical protein IJU44_03420 [Kiritimatiellae bacterium]|nr:hypothetical protein [Kiritimatiellia bacterium]